MKYSCWNDIIVVLLSFLVAQLALVKGLSSNETSYMQPLNYNPGAIVYEEDHCPPWFFYSESSKKCECYSSPITENVVKCSNREALLKLGHCMTYEEGSGFHVGLCNNINLIVSKLNTTKDN